MREEPPGCRDTEGLTKANPVKFLINPGRHASLGFSLMPTRDIELLIPVNPAECMSGLTTGLRLNLPAYQRACAS